MVSPVDLLLRREHNHPSNNASGFRIKVQPATCGCPAARMDFPLGLPYLDTEDEG
jgi:hypothetical protein